MEQEKLYDVIVVGGSYSGLSAAMSLGRALRKTLILDSGEPCNKPTPHSHNFITNDGNTPAQIAGIAKEQVLHYPTVTFKSATVVNVSGSDMEFAVSTLDGDGFFARKILFTTGVKDNMLPIPGFAECWGKSVIHCPYCHGYEYKDEPTGILTNGDKAGEFGALIHNWTSKLTIFTNGPSTISQDDMQKLAAWKIPIVSLPISAINHADGQLHSVTLDDGSAYKLTALYARPGFKQHSHAPEQLGCAIKDGYIVVDAMQKTSVKGIYAAGDNTMGLRSVAAAVAAGSKAGAIINHELIHDEFHS
jgi:thioredoxin reductase